jgi:hypothetical protein
VLSGLSGKERETLRRLLAKALEQQASATA